MKRIVALLALSFAVVGCGGSHSETSSATDQPSTDPKAECAAGVMIDFLAYNDLSRNGTFEGGVPALADKYGQTSPIFDFIIRNQGDYNFARQQYGRDSVQVQAKFEKLLTAAENNPRVCPG